MPNSQQQIRRWLLESHTSEPMDRIYGPDEISLMRAALERSWAALAFAHWSDEKDALRTRERLALTILRETACGERRVSALTDNALGSIEPRSAQAPRA